MSDPGQAWVVVFRNDADAVTTIADHRRFLGEAIDETFVFALKGYASTLSAVDRQRVAADARVEFLSPDASVKTFELSATGAARIGAEVDPPVSPVDDRVAVGIAVVDSGVETDHPDLNVVGGVDCSGDPIWPGIGDIGGHGTHVAGIAAARRNGFGITGVAPGAPIWSVRVFDNLGRARLSNLLCGLDWLVANGSANGIRVVNLSLGASGVDRGSCGGGADALHRAVCTARDSGLVLVVAAGNESGGVTETIPAAYDEVITVTAIADYDGRPGNLASARCGDDNDATYGDDDTAASFSNFANTRGSDVTHTMAAPGVCITSTWPGHRFATKSGTSMAAPYVTGVAARCIAQQTSCAHLGPKDVGQILLREARQAPAAHGFKGDPRSPIKERYYGNLVTAQFSSGDE